MKLIETWSLAHLPGKKWGKPRLRTEALHLGVLRLSSYNGAFIHDDDTHPTTHSLSKSAPELVQEAGGS